MQNLSESDPVDAMSMIYEFGPFRLDPSLGLLMRGTEPTELGQRAVALLRLLVERGGQPVSKEVLIEAAWAGLAVEESNLTVQIAALRKVLVNPQRLKELLIKDLLTPFAIKRRLSYAQLNDLVRRAMADKVFDLSASADEFANPFLDEFETTYWLENLERSGRAAHLFTTDGPDAAPPEDT